MLMDEPARGGAYKYLESVMRFWGSNLFNGGDWGPQVPPKPVAKPTVPSDASISTKKDPSTLMPQLVREPRYFSHLEQGVEIGESINLDDRKHHHEYT